MRRTQVRQIVLWLLLLCGLASPAMGVSETLRLAGAGGALGTMQQMGAAFAQHVPDVTVNVLPVLGSGGGIKALLAGAIDIGLSGSPLKDAEARTGAKAIAYAQAPLVFATPRDNPHVGFSRAAIVAIHTGSLTTWPDGTLLQLVLRPEADVDVDILKAHIPGMKAAYARALKRRELPLGITDQDTADSIERTRWALGAFALPLILSEERPLKALQLDNVAPTPENVANGSYTLAKTFYFVIPASPHPLVQQFLAFVHSDAGAAILRRTGHHLLDFTVQE